MAVKYWKNNINLVLLVTAEHGLVSVKLILLLVSWGFCDDVQPSTMAAHYLGAVHFSTEE